MDEQIINTIRRMYPYPGETLSNEEIERRAEQIQHIVEENGGAGRTTIDYLEREKTSAGGSKRWLLENLLSRLRNRHRL